MEYKWFYHYIFFNKDEFNSQDSLPDSKPQISGEIVFGLWFDYIKRETLQK